MVLFESSYIQSSSNKDLKESSMFIHLIINKSNYWSIKHLVRNNSFSVSLQRKFICILVINRNTTQHTIGTITMNVPIRLLLTNSFYLFRFSCTVLLNLSKLCDEIPTVENHTIICFELIVLVHLVGIE